MFLDLRLQLQVSKNIEFLELDPNSIKSLAPKRHKTREPVPYLLYTGTYNVPRLKYAGQMKE
jgi:hypothetical protein